MFLRLIRIELSPMTRRFVYFIFRKSLGGNRVQYYTSVPAFAATFQLIDLLLTTVRRTIGFPIFHMNGHYIVFPRFLFHYIYVYCLRFIRKITGRYSVGGEIVKLPRRVLRRQRRDAFQYLRLRVIIARGRYNNIHLQFLPPAGTQCTADKNINSLPRLDV